MNYAYIVGGDEIYLKIEQFIIILQTIRIVMPCDNKYPLRLNLNVE